MAEFVFLSGFFLFVCAFNRILCFRVKSFFYDVKYRRFFGFVILSEDLEDLGGLLKSAFIAAFNHLLLYTNSLKSLGNQLCLDQPFVLIIFLN